MEAIIEDEVTQRFVAEELKVIVLIYCANIQLGNSSLFFSY